MENTTLTLRERWNQLKEQQPNMRIRNAAVELGVSEAELLATQCGENVTRLRPEFRKILQEMESLGKVMALTRNDDVVHERKGIYLNPSLDNPHVGLFVGEDIDLRLFFANWASVYAVTETLKDQPRYSIQFFAKDGEAIHKIYLTSHSNETAYHEIVSMFRHEDQNPEQAVSESDAPETELPDAEIDVASFQEGWVNLKDTHHFFTLVKKHKLTRTQALRLAPEGNYAVKVQPNAFRQVLTSAAEKEIPVMVFVGNQGMIQIHTGPVKRLMDHDGWFNVLDPDFNLHVREIAITDCWVVRKPTEDGVVTALECFDKNGFQVMQLFGKRKPGIPEMESWREIVAATEETLQLV